MLVQEIIRNKEKQLGLIVNNQYIDFSNAVSLYLKGALDNVVLVNNSYFRSKPNYNVRITEVDSYVKGNESSLGQISRPEVKSGRCNKGGSFSSENSIRKSGCKEVDNRGGRGSGATRKSRFKDAQSSGSETIRYICLRLKKSGCVVYTEDTPERFSNDFNNAKLAQKNGACVDEHSLEELGKMKLLRSSNGFVAVENNGNINSVLRDTRKPKTKNFLRDLILNAIVNGGYKLDCFAILEGGSIGGLAEMYSQYGFIPVVKDRFNKDFAPEGWNYERDGEPDVVFMYHCGDSVETVIKKSDSKSYKHYLDYDVPYITALPQYVTPPNDYDWDTDKDDLSTYSQAMRYRDWVMEKSRKFKN